MQNMITATKKTSNTAEIMSCKNHLIFIFKVLIGITIKEKYKVTGFIRGGGFGDVFNAVHTEKNYEVAVKFVSLTRHYWNLGRSQ